MPIRLNGSTSGYVELAAPAVAGSTVLELPTDSIKPGLVLVASSSFTAASTVSVNNCFTSTYNNYKVVYSLTSVSANCDINWRWRASGADATGSLYGTTYQGYSTSAGSEGGQTNLVAQGIVGKAFSGYTGSGELEVHDAAVARYPMVKGYHVRQTEANEKGFLDFMSSYQSATAYDGFTLYPSTGTFTGDVYVYGYRRA